MNCGRCETAHPGRVGDEFCLETLKADLRGTQNVLEATRRQNERYASEVGRWEKEIETLKAERDALQKTLDNVAASPASRLNRDLTKDLARVREERDKWKTTADSLATQLNEKIESEARLREALGEARLAYCIRWCEGAGEDRKHRPECEEFRILSEMG